MGSEQWFLTPFPGDPGDLRDPRESSGRLNFVDKRGTKSTFAWKIASKFKQKSDRAPREHLGSPREGSPRAPKRSPRAPQRSPRAPPKEPKGTPKTPKGSQRDKIYIYIFTNSRSTTLSGRYVTVYFTAFEC